MATAITACEITDGATVGYNLVTLRVTKTDADEIAFSTDGGATWSAWAPCNGDYYEQELPPGDGARVVDVKVRRGESEASDSAACTVNSWPMTLSLLNNLPATYARASSGPLYAILGACAVWLGHFTQSVQKLRSELNPVAARGHWLNVWGRLFGVERKSTESDAVFAQRLIPTVTSPKNTLAALQQAVRAECSASVVVTELEAYPCFVLVDLTAAGAFDLNRVWKSIYRVKPAGAKVVVKQ